MLQTVFLLLLCLVKLKLDNFIVALYGEIVIITRELL